MKRPVMFALEVVVGLFIAVGGAWIAARTALKANDKANADVRASLADNRIAAATERIADALEHNRLPRPSLLSTVDLKPIPEPDAPCGERFYTCDSAQTRLVHAEDGPPCETFCKVAPFTAACTETKKRAKC